MSISGKALVAMNSSDESMDRHGPEPASALIIALIQRAALAQAVCVAAELRVADLIAEGSNSLDELAQATESHKPSLHRLLRGLASLGLCTEDRDGWFKLTATGSLLRSDAPDSLRSWLVWFGKYQWPAWGNLLHSVQTGKSARVLVTGTEGFELVQADPHAAALFNHTMTQLTRAVAGEVARAYDFNGARHIVDVGGGHGMLLATILRAYPHLRGTILDLPHAIDGARQQFHDLGLADRCELIAGDFFKSVPRSADAYLLKNIIHDWHDDRSSIILRNCRQAIPSDGKLLLVERVMPSRIVESSFHRGTVYADLAMLIGPGGRERTAVELRRLLEDAGFKLVRTISTTSGFSILEAVPL